MTTAKFSDIEKALITNIKKTENNLKIAVAWFTNPHLFVILVSLCKSGKSIELILADDIINFSNQLINFQELIDLGIEMRISKFPKLMHNKFCIIDDRLLISGSYNWTLRAEKNNHENVIISNELNLISQFSLEFNTLKKFTEKLVSINSSSFNSYTSKTEIQEEKKLIEEFEFLNTTKNDEEHSRYEEISDEIESLLDSAELLYLQGKHQEAIDVCFKILESAPYLPVAYDIIASSKWRQGKYKEQINFAKKAIELDNKYYRAYNLLGIGYALIGNAQESIKNYNYCISNEPDNYLYYRNRVSSYIELEGDLSITIPKSIRDQFTRKADLDLNKIIEITNRLEPIDKSYNLFQCRGDANMLLNKLQLAKADLLKAKELYEKEDKRRQDIHDFKEIKESLKIIEQYLR